MHKEKGGSYAKEQAQSESPGDGRIGVGPHINAIIKDLPLEIQNVIKIRVSEFNKKQDQERPADVLQCIEYLLSQERD